MKIFIINDNTAGNIIRLTDAKGLIEYANEAHFIQDGACAPCDNISDAKSILETDYFTVTEYEFDEGSNINLSEAIYG